MWISDALDGWAYSKSLQEERAPRVEKLGFVRASSFSVTANSTLVDVQLCSSLAVSPKVRDVMILI